MNCARGFLFFNNVDTLEAKSIKWFNLTFQRNNRNYQLLVGICQLIIEGLLLTTESGVYRLQSWIDEQRMCHLYEKFILEYYKKHYPVLSVKAAQIPWGLDDGVSYMLPKMQSDIIYEKEIRCLLLMLSITVIRCRQIFLSRLDFQQFISNFLLM